MANIMQMFRAKNKVSRDSYDLSKKIAFTAAPGELNVVYARNVMSNDYFEIDSTWKTRTAPLNTSAFTRFREYYDWYFVPFNLLWDKYHTWVTAMTDNNQVATSLKGTSTLTDKHPYITTNQIRTYLQGMKASYDNTTGVLGSSARNIFGIARYQLQQKLLHQLGYGDFYDLDDTPLYNLELAPWRLLAYQKIYQDWYRNSQWEASSPQTCNINYISGAAGDLQMPIGDYQVQDDSIFDIRYANWNKDLFTGLLPNSQYGDAASVNMGSGDVTIVPGSTSSAPIRIFSETASGSVLDTTTLGPVSPPTGANSLVRANNSNSGNSIQFFLDSDSVSSLRSSMGLSSTSSGTLTSAFTILALRQAEALQKWKEITESNSKDFPSQIEAHFGVRPNNAYSQRCVRLGGYDATIEIQDVDNTNITENEDGSVNAARIAGKAVARGQGKKIEFKSEVPGVIMCIYHVMPLLDYALAGVNMENMKTQFTDYPIPEFDRTGMQQVPLAAFTNKKSDVYVGSQNIQLGDGLLGYAPNYIDAKTDIDEVKGAFYNGGLETWVSPITGEYVRRWFSPYGDTTGTGYRWQGLNFKFFKVSPFVTNPIFAIPYDGTVQTEHFWVNCYHSIHAVRPLDAQGLPY